MRIGIDAACWSNKRGYGRFTREMLTALLALDRKNDYVFFVDSTTACLNNFPPNAERIVVSLSKPPTKAASAHGRRSIPDLFKLGRSVCKEELDFFLYTSVYTYFPIFSSAKKIFGTYTGLLLSVRKLMNSGGDNLLATRVVMRLNCW